MSSYGHYMGMEEEDCGVVPSIEELQERMRVKLSPKNMSHFINVCSCGRVLAQCRCPDNNKPKTVIERGCDICHGSSVIVTRQGTNWIVQDMHGNEIKLSAQDWRYLHNIIHEYYHGED